MKFPHQIVLYTSGYLVRNPSSSLIHTNNHLMSPSMNTEYTCEFSSYMIYIVNFYIFYRKLVHKENFVSSVPVLVYIC